MSEVKKEQKEPKKEAAPKAKSEKTGSRKKAGEGISFAVQVEKPKASEISPRLKTMYLEKIVPSLMKEFNFKNKMEVPKITKIALSSTTKDTLVNPKVVDYIVEELAMITGQKPTVARSKKSIAGFKLRAGQPIGAIVTLRRSQMYEFMDRFINIALPRVRDFRGINPKSFDGRGNYSMGVKEQIIFPEINYDKVDKIRGMNITFTTSATKNEHARALLQAFGMPFRKA